jgi:uncharacterized protein YbjT (DUF2867 family)
MKVLVTGATGYIGGRLVPHLLRAGHEVRVFVRDRNRVSGRRWIDSVEVTEGDVLVRDSLEVALRDVDAAYYLIHSMRENSDYRGVDRQAAENFLKAGRNLKQLVYLGGLLPPVKKVSQHLKSRAEVGEIFRSNLPTTEFRAGPIIGSGSASFELVRYLTERLPLMIAPSWINHEVQPIAIRSMLQYLVLALGRQETGVFEVGSDRLTFRAMLEVYAEERGLSRSIITVPPFVPVRFASFWVSLITPLPRSLSIPLMEGIIHPVVADLSATKRAFPEVETVSYRRAVRLAFLRISEKAVTTRWTGALGQQLTLEHIDREGSMREVRSIYVDFPPEAVFASFSSIGGDRGWLAWEWVWEIRGLIDELVGGPGLRRGRRHPTELLPGDTLDFWRVEHVDNPHLLRLKAQMKVPGRAWLQWEAKPEGSGTRLIQEAAFVPLGFWGTVYWYSLYPIHQIIFRSLIRAIAGDAELFDSSKRSAAEPETFS